MIGFLNEFTVYSTADNVLMGCHMCMYGVAGFLLTQPVGTCSTQMRKRAFLSSIGISFARASVYLLVLYSSSSRLFTRTQMDGTLFIAIQKWWFVNS